LKEQSEASIHELKPKTIFAFGVGEKLLPKSLGTFTVRDSKSKQKLKIRSCSKNATLANVFKNYRPETLFCLEDYENYYLSDDTYRDNREKYKLEITLNPCNKKR